MNTNVKNGENMNKIHQNYAHYFNLSFVTNSDVINYN